MILFIWQNLIIYLFWSCDACRIDSDRCNYWNLEMLVLTVDFYKYCLLEIS